MGREGEVGDHVVPLEVTQSKLKACMSCSLIKTTQQFVQDGCDNCPFMSYINDRERVGACTTSQFVGYVAHSACILIPPFLFSACHSQYLFVSVSIRAALNSTYVVMNPKRSWVSKWQRVGELESPFPLHF